MGSIRPAPGWRWSTPDHISRTVTVRAAVSGAIAAAAGLTATYRLVPSLAWGLCVMAAIALFGLASGYPLGTLQKRPSVLTWLASTALLVAAALSAATGGVRSVNLVIDLTVFSVSATLFRPPLSMFAALANGLIIALPGLWAGHHPMDGRATIALLGASLAIAYYSPVAYEGVIAGLRNQQRLEAAAAIGRAMTALDLGRILPDIAAETGRLLGAGEVVITAAQPDAPAEQARWTDGRQTAPITEAEVQAGGARAAQEGATLMLRPAARDWRAVPPGGLLPTDAVGLALPYGAQEKPAGTITIAASAHAYLPTWALAAVRDIADATALGVRAAILHAESQRQALMDPITHLYNARYLGLRLQEEVARADRRRDPLSLLFLDSDSLKIINDRYGHQHGDRLVRGLAQMILQNIRTEDVPVRYAGGDEFIVILPNTHWHEAAEIADRLRNAARHLPVGPRGEPLGTVSIGVATYPVHAMGADELVDRADQAMYAAKSAGKDCVAVYGQGTQAPAQTPNEPFLAP